MISVYKCLLAALKRIHIVRLFLFVCGPALLASAIGAEELVVATYNVRNYLSMDRVAVGRYRKDFPKPASETAVVRETIRAVAPDFIALQEIGSAGHLKELQTDLKNEGLAYRHSALLEAADPDRRLAALWNIDQPYRVLRHDDLEIRYFGGIVQVSRGLLEVEFADDVGKWSVFIVHLKSKYTNRDDDIQSLRRRTLEARAARDRILQRYPDPAKSRFLVVGDFNDTLGSAPMRAFWNRGDLKICQDVLCKDERGEIWTHYYKKEGTYSKVDYILRSTGFRALGSAEGVIHDRKNAYWGSDHRLVWASF